MVKIRKQYTAEFKQEAVGLVTEHGYSYAEAGRSLGFEPVDREMEKLGYDIESRIPNSGRLRFIEVKGRISGAATPRCQGSCRVTEMKTSKDWGRKEVSHDPVFVGT